MSRMNDGQRTRLLNSACGIMQEGRSAWPDFGAAILVAQEDGDQELAQDLYETFREARLMNEAGPLLDMGLMNAARSPAVFLF